jgi:small-conductance mechanosensitive channel
MADGSVFRGSIEFLERLGVYDVVLPFLLVFSIMFAVLEKTRVFGTEEMHDVKDKKVTRKNINAMVAFVMAFLVIASSKMVGWINTALPRIVLLVIVSICFLLLIGVFYSEKEDVYFEKGPWRNFFIVLMFIGVVLIFMGVITIADTDETWLEWTYDKVVYQFDDTAVSSIIMFLVVLGLMFFVTKEPKADKKDSKS